MKHNSDDLVEITQLQATLKLRIDLLTANIDVLLNSSNINTLASAPKLESNLNALNSLHQRIDCRINEIRCR